MKALEFVDQTNNLFARINALVGMLYADGKRETVDGNQLASYSDILHEEVVKAETFYHDYGQELLKREQDEKS